MQRALYIYCSHSVYSNGQKEGPQKHRNHFTHWVKCPQNGTKWNSHCKYGNTKKRRILTILQKMLTMADPKINIVIRECGGNNFFLKPLMNTLLVNRTWYSFIWISTRIRVFMLFSCSLVWIMLAGIKIRKELVTVWIRKVELEETVCNYAFVVE